VPTSALSTLAWSATAIFLSFFVFTQLSVMLCFVVGSTVSPFVAPLALLLSLAVGDWLARREGLRGRLRIVPSAMVLTVVALALYLASAFFDMSWDGLWYHQTAMYQMSHGWNPLRDPMHNLAPHLQDWLHHYAKGPWYVALALFQTTHHIEWAKAAPWMALAATFLAVFAASTDFGLRRRTAIVVAALVSLNPVVTCQLVSYLVDGLMVSFMACFVAALFRWFRRPSLLIRWILMASAILCINAKLTGLVYLCFGCAAGGLYALMKRRDLLIRYAAFQFACILLGGVVFGFNPFVTNTVHRGNPFYPWLGSAAHPSFAQRGQDPNELYETPKNMAGHSRFFRFYYAIFSHPGPQTFLNGEPAQLMWPFNVRWNDFTAFRFHEVRISGFGPLFSGAFLISLCLLGVALVRPGIPREIVVLLVGAIVASLLVSVHTWWARYGPQLWWLPIIAVIAGLQRCVPVGSGSAPASGAVAGALACHSEAGNEARGSAAPAATETTGEGAGRNTRGRACSPTRWAAWGLAALLLINAVLVGAAHFRWEMEATRTTHEQMALLRQKGEIEVNFQYFREPFGERLRAAGVTFRAVGKLPCDHPMELMSVVPGYPGTIPACFNESKSSKP
jgi:hypothetical protein